MHCMLMDLLHGFEVLSTTEETSWDGCDLVTGKSVGYVVMVSTDEPVQARCEVQD